MSAHAIDQIPLVQPSASTRTLVLEGLSHVYGLNQGTGRNIVESIRYLSLDVPRGQFMAMIGPSGCGKTTLFNILGGLLRPTSGRALVNGKEVKGPDPALASVFQEESLFPWRTTLSNIMFGLEARKVPRGRRGPTARAMLELVGLTRFEDSYPHELSGGMKQRVAIARALAVDPDVLLLDEPFGALDQQTRLRLGAEVARIWQETQKTIVLITHDINEAVYLADRVIVLTDRPCTICEDITIDLPRPRTFDLFTKSAFHEYTDRVWRALPSLDDPARASA